MSNVSSVFSADDTNTSASDPRPVSYVQAIREQDEPQAEHRNVSSVSSVQDATLPAADLECESAPNVVEETIEPDGQDGNSSEQAVTTDAIANPCSSSESYEHTVMVREATGTLRRIEAENESQMGAKPLQNTLPEDSEVTDTRTEESVAADNESGKTSDDVDGIETDARTVVSKGAVDSVAGSQEVSKTTGTPTDSTPDTAVASDAGNNTTDSASDSERKSNTPTICVEVRS